MPELDVVRGDIARQRVDAIVKAANSSLLGAAWTVLAVATTVSRVVFTCFDGETTQLDERLLASGWRTTPISGGPHECGPPGVTTTSGPRARAREGRGVVATMVYLSHIA